MRQNSVKKLTLAAMLAAMTCVATMIIQVPSPMNGYVNLGDCFVLLSGFLLGPFYGVAAAAIGSMMADILLGYAIYAPATFIIKGAMAFVAWRVYTTGGHKTSFAIIGAILAELIMIAGYFVFDGFILGYGLAAAGSIPGNSVQASFGIIAGIALLKITEKCIPQLKKNSI